MVAKAAAGFKKNGNREMGVAGPGGQGPGKAARRRSWPRFSAYVIYAALAPLHNRVMKTMAV
jgi:hypothetical protein